MSFGTVSPAEFTSWLGSVGGLAKANRFIVRLQPPDPLMSISQSAVSAFNTVLQDDIGRRRSRGGVADVVSYLSFACNAVTLPPQTLTTADARTYGSAYKLPWGRSYDNFSTTFLLSQKGFERKFFEAWIDLIADPYTGDARYHSEFAAKELSIFCVPDHVSGDFETNNVFHWQAYGAYPIVLNGHNFSHDSENELLKLEVEWTAMEWNLVGSMDGKGPIKPELRNTVDTLDVSPPFIKNQTIPPITKPDGLNALNDVVNIITP